MGQSFFRTFDETVYVFRPCELGSYVVLYDGTPAVGRAGNGDFRFILALNISMPPKTARGDLQMQWTNWHLVAHMSYTEGNSSVGTVPCIYICG